MRWLGLLSVAAIGVHELRYVAAPGSHAHDVFSAQAHAYLPLAAALVLLVFIASVAQFVSSLVVARSGEISPPIAASLPQRLGRGDGCPAGDLRRPGIPRGSASGRPSGGAARPLRPRRLVRLRIRTVAGRPGGLPFRGAQQAIELAALAAIGRSTASRSAIRDAAAGRRGGASRPLARNLAGRAPPVPAS